MPCENKLRLEQQGTRYDTGRSVVSTSEWLQGRGNDRAIDKDCWLFVRNYTAAVQNADVAFPVQCQNGREMTVAPPGESMASY